MRVLRRAVIGALVANIVFVSQTASAAQSPSVSARAPHQSVGSRLDAPLAPAKSQANARVPYRVPDQAALARAKDAAAANANGPAPLRNDFSLGATPASRSVQQGASTTYTVNTQATGNAKPIALSVSGLAAGASGTFSPASVQAGQSSTLTVTTTNTATTGTFTLTITGVYSSPPTTHTTTVSLTITPRPLDDFSITATPSSQGVLQGSSTTYTVSTQLTSGSAQTIALSLAGLPPDASGTFMPTSVSTGGSSTLTVTAGAATPTGTFTLTITGTGSSTTRSTSVTVTISAPQADDFSVGASPSSASVVQGASASYSVTTQAVTGTPQTISLSVSGLPLGATGTFNPASVTAGASSTLTVTTSGVGAGTYTLTIQGAYASPPTTHTVSVSLTVSAPVIDDFSIAVTPATRSVVQGATTTYSVITQVTSGAAQSVSLAVSGLPVGATGTFAPASITSGASAVLTVTTAGTTPVATYSLTVTGTGTSTTHSATANLAVTASAGGPTIGVSWNGQNEPDLAPPDPTGAIGPNSFIQLTNLRYGIYGRDGSLIDQADLGELTRFPVSELSDPQIVWDPTSQRYYYLVVDIYTSAYAFGYSKTADPRSGASDFCHYQIGAFYGSFYLPDYPKMAVTQDFVLVGSNVFLLFSFYQGSDVNWFVKPTNPVCPSQLGAGGTFSALKNADGSLMSTPEPAVMADPASGGWIVGSNDVSTSGGANYLTVYRVTKSAQGLAQLSGPMTVTVPAYAVPANAPQSGTDQLIDTMDTRLTHAVAAYDPRIDATAIWTAHTVFGGAGAEVRWFEISTAGTPSLAQTGTVTDPNLYVFNGAVSPDRAADDVLGGSAVTGRNMVLGYNTSSSATFSAIRMVSKRGDGPQSAPVLVQQSVGPYVDFGCGSSVPNVCRWGDYAGAVPDPLVANGGQVWLSAEWNEPATDGSTPTWRTWNWSARP